MRRISDIFYHYEAFSVQNGEITHSTCIGLNPSVFEGHDSRYYQNSVVIFPKSKEISELRLGLDVLPPGYTVVHRRNRSLFGNFILDGSGMFNDSPFAGGDFFYANPTVKNNIIASDNSDFHSYWFLLRGRGLDRLSEELRRLLPLQVIPFRRNCGVEKFFEFFMTTADAVNTDEKFVRGIFSMILSYLSSVTKAENFRADALPRSIGIARRAMRMMESDYAHISIESLAEQLYIDRKYLYHEFISATGISPQEYLIKCKLHGAATYLTETDYTIQKIVELTGYNHRNSLTVAFRHQYGCTPSEFRQKNNSNTNPA